MAGVMVSLKGSNTARFLLFIVLVWVAVDLGIVLRGVAKLPEPVGTLVAPTVTPGASDPSKI